jgi:hypothetical protein
MLSVLQNLNVLINYVTFTITKYKIYSILVCVIFL